MAAKKVSVLARIRAEKGREKQVKEALLLLVDLSKADKGCINYDLHQASEDQALFIFYENWQSKEDLEKHLGTAHVQDFLAKSKDLLAEPVEIILMEMIS